MIKGAIKGKTGNILMIQTEGIIDYPIDTMVEIKKFSGKRSRNANAYFHVLVDELRQKLNISFAHCKNILITSYGQIEYLGDEPMIYKTNAPPEYVRELEEIHMKYIKASDDGAYFYKVYRGSHTYDSAEMAKLIDGTIMDCKDQGIDTMTPNELLRLEGYGR